MISTQHTVRPYVDLAPFQLLLDRLRLRVGADSIGADGHAVIHSDIYGSELIRLEFAADDEGMDVFTSELVSSVAALGLDLDDIEIAVIASSSYLKTVEVLFRRRADELTEVPRVISLTTPDRPRSLSSPRSGARIEVVVCLSRNVPQKPLRPWRRGTWLAQTQFMLRSEATGRNFRLRPLGETDRLRLGLPKGTMRHVEVSGPAIESLSDESSVSVWIDPQLLARLSSNPSAPAAKALQLQLFIDVVGAVLASARESVDFAHVGFDDIEDTLLGRILEALARGRLGQTAERRRAARELLLDAARTDPEKFLSYTSASVGLLRATMEVLDR